MPHRNLYVWSNDRHSNSFKAFFSALRLHSPDANYSDNAKLASLWCLVDGQQPFTDLHWQYQMLSNRPKVVCLSSEDVQLPNPKWIYFKTPVHVRTLHNWMEQQIFDQSSNRLCQNTYTEHDDPLSRLMATSADAQPVTISASTQSNPPISSAVTTQLLPRWQNEAFKLQYWPNVSAYSDSPEIVQLCSLLIHGWVKYDALSHIHLDKIIIVKLLRDAEAEQNLIYYLDNQEASDANAVEQIDEVTASEVNKSQGFFKKLFGKFASN